MTKNYQQLINFAQCLMMFAGHQKETAENLMQQFVPKGLADLLSPAFRGRLPHFGAISRSPAASLKSPASLALSKIVKIVATRCHILRLRCTKFDFGWGFAPDPTGGDHSVLPDPLAGFKWS